MDFTKPVGLEETGKLQIDQAEFEELTVMSLDSKKAIAQAASMAVSIKSVLDAPLLTVDGSLTEESERVLTEE